MSLPFRRAASTPGALRTWILPPREGGFHERRSHCTDTCPGKAASLVIGCAVDPTLPCGSHFISLLGLLTRL